jgi:alkylation response protein AidB-like acyl-CoA dehydrogenase
MGLVETARELGPQLAARSDEIEKLRRLPPDVAKRLGEAGFYRIFVPTDLGGLGGSPLEAMEVIETLAEFDASAAWVTFIGMTSATALLRVPQETAREMLSDPSTLIAGVFAPTGKGVVSDEGVRFTGRWRFGSGSQNARWILGGCFFEQHGEPLRTQSGSPRMHLVLFAHDEVEFLDTWHVSGLRGTGSCDFRVDDVLVPEERISGWTITENPEVPIGRFPNFTLLAILIGSVCLGTARAALGDFVELASSKTGFAQSRRLADQQRVQMDVARAEAGIRAARSYLYETVEAGWDLAVRGEDVPVDARRDIRLATTFAVQQATEAVDRVYTLAGGTSLYETSRLQRHFRDVHTATQHVSAAENVYEMVGRLFLGVAANTRVL